MVVTTPLRPVTKIIFSLLYSLKSQNSLRSDSWLFKLFLAVGKKLFLHVTGLTLRCHHHPCPVAKLLQWYLAVGKVISSRPRPNAPLMANRPGQTKLMRSGQALSPAVKLLGVEFCKVTWRRERIVADNKMVSWGRGVGEVGGGA